MIDRAHRLPVKKQCELLEVNRSSIYYRPKGPSEADLALARRIDEIHVERPVSGQPPCLRLQDRQENPRPAGQRRSESQPQEDLSA